MKFLFTTGIGAVAAAGALLATTSIAFAQASPGMPGDIFNDGFQLQAHPQLEFPASAPSKKYQTGAPTRMRRLADDGDPNGCNLKCPDPDGNN